MFVVLMIPIGIVPVTVQDKVFKKDTDGENEGTH